MSLVFHVYAFCWNESRMIQKFLNHYKQADEIYIIDNMSDDDTKEIVHKNNRHIINVDTNGNINESTRVNETYWRNNDLSNVDFIVLADIDEMLHFPSFPGDIKSALLNMKMNGITVVKTKGYQMFCSDEYYNNILPDQNLCTAVTDGFYDNIKLFSDFDKVLCFDPNKISKMNFCLGKHKCNPIGTVKYDTVSSMLLHYKFTGKTYLEARHLSLQKRLTQQAIAQKIDTHYVGDVMIFINRYYEEWNGKNIFNIMYPGKFINFCSNNRYCVIDENFSQNSSFLNYIYDNYIEFSIDNSLLAIAKLNDKNINYVGDNYEVKKILDLNGWKITENMACICTNLTIKIDNIDALPFEYMSKANCIITKTMFNNSNYIFKNKIDDQNIYELCKK